MRIFLDAMGGDNAPQAPVAGALEALRRFPRLEIVLAGDPAAIEPLLKDGEDVRSRLTVLDAPEVITNHESPVMGVRRKTKSATVIGMLQLRDKEVDGFVSAGSTGAVLAGGMFRLGRIPGIERPALAPLLPNGKGNFLLIDCGANVDCQADWLNQFAVMGSAYMESVMGIANPRVGLINIGAESEKGNALVKAAYPLMERAPYNFVGNVEAREAVEGSVDVIVADGYSGNIFLKTMEGTGLFLAREIKKIFKQNLLTKLAAVMVSGGLKRFKKLMDSSEVGGTALVGISKTVIKAHGSSNAYAFQNAIRQASQSVSSGLIENITANIDLMRLDAPEKE